MPIKATIRKNTDKLSEKEPIIVSNPKDPRLKAYRDSLNLYNKYLSDVKWAANYFKTTPKSVLESYKPLRKSVDSEEYKKLYDYQRNYEDLKNNIKPTAIYAYGEHPFSGVREYKKPTQPVIYKKFESEIKKEEAPKKEESKPVKGIVFNKKPELLVDKSGRYTWFQENREGDLIPIRRATLEEIKSVKQ